MASSPRKCRIGFMSTANIGGKYCRAIQDECADVAELAAVASRDLTKAKAWADKFGVKKAYGSYEELLADKEIDAVYMPLPCALHREWATKAAAAGKSVMIEKPTALSAAELTEIVSACAAANVQLMDGTMFSHHDRLPRFREALQSVGCKGDNGDGIIRIVSGFSFLGDADFMANNIRIQKDLEPFGSLGDLGWYSIRFALWAMGWTLPTHVTARATAWGPGGEAGGVPVDVVANLVFGASAQAGGSGRGPADGAAAPGMPVQMQFDCAFTSPFRQWVEVSAPSGVVSMNDFVISRSHSSCEFSVVRNPGLDALHSNVLGERETVEIRGCNQEARMIRKFAELTLSGKPDPFWPRISLLTQAVLDACQESIRKGGAEVKVVAPSAV
jgi:predicted dehydrogenase